MAQVKKRIQKLHPARKRAASPDEIRQVALLCRARLGDQSARQSLTAIITPAIKKNAYGRFSSEIESDAVERVFDTFAFRTLSETPTGPMPAYASVVALRVRMDIEKKYRDDPCQLDADVRATHDPESHLVEIIAVAQAIDELTPAQQSSLQHYLNIVPP